jgi:D-3-phosphoglycerate dehydrogenase
MIDEDALEQMKDGVIIINCSRGGTIDEDALLAALVKNKVGGVGLDVYEEEPVDATRELIQHPLVITTAHNGAQTAEASRNNSTVIADKLVKFFDQ